MDQDDFIHDASTEGQEEGENTVDPFSTVDSQQVSSSQILGDYRLLQQLGKGGMGIVYEAESLLGGKKVALKTLQSGSAETLARLKSEFRVLTDLAHPNLVRLGELNTTHHAPFFTMEIVRGVPFDQYVLASLESVAAVPAFPYNEQRLRETLLQLARGLNALHEIGLVHRDIKPSNVMVNHDGRVVVLDMGLAVAVEEYADANNEVSLAGTPYYMSPEQMQGQTVTAACDWYAVGVMLFEVLTGEKLFQKRSLSGLLSEKFNTQSVRVRDILSTVPEDLSDLCERLLNVDPAERPESAEVLELLSGNAAVRAEPAVWIGRQSELKQLADAWQKVQQGVTQVVFVSGRSGMGKTALIDHFLSDLRRNCPIVVLRGRCYENEAVPYRGIDSIVDALAGYLQRLPRSEVERILPIDLDVLCQVFPVLRGVPSLARQLKPLAVQGAEARDLGQRGIAALREMLCRLARFEPVVIFIDDLQQGDEDTASVFRELFRVDQSPNLLCLGTFRSEDAESSVCLNRIRRNRLSGAEQALLAEQHEINIDRLSRDEAAQLARSLLTGNESVRAREAARIADEAGGDPLFVRMLAEDLNYRTAGTSKVKQESDNVENEWSLHEVIEKRLRALDKIQRGAIELLATAGRPLDALDLEAVVGRREDSVGLIRSLRIQKLIKRLGDRERIELYHDKIRETAISIISEQRQAKICLTLAEHLESHSGDLDVEFLADLCRRGGDLERAGTYYQSSAKKAEAAFAFNRAIECYRYALKFLQSESEAKAGLHIGLADALANASRSSEAAGEYLKAAELVDSESSTQLQQLAALRYLTSGHVEKGISTLRSVLDHHRLPWPATRVSAIAGLLIRNGKLRCSSLVPKIQRQMRPQERQVIDTCWAAAAGLSLVDPLRGSYYVSETLLRSLSCGSVDTLPRDLAAFMGQTAIGGSRSRGATKRVLLAVRALDSQRKREPYSRAMSLLSRGIAALLRGEWKVALHCCDRAVGHLSSQDCIGKTWELSTARTFALWSLQYQGNLVELARRQPELLHAAIEADDLFATLNYGTQVMAHLELAANRPAEALRRLEEDRNRLSEEGFFIQHHNYVLAKAYTFLYMGDYENALKSIDRVWPKYQQSFLSQIQQVRIDYFQVLCRALLGAAENNISRAANLKRVRQIIRRLKAEKVEWATGFATAFEAASDWIEGKRVASLKQLLLSQQMFERNSMLLFSMAARQIAAKIDQDITDQDFVPWKDCGVDDGQKMARTLLPGFG